MTGGYALLGKNAVAFELGAYDRSQPLIIDPLLTYVSYLGGSGGDQGIAIAVDPAEAAWVTGSTSSIDFPITPTAFQSTNYGDQDVFISKVSPDGSTLEFSTYEGGSNNDDPAGIAVDPAGNVYVVGSTRSGDFRSPWMRFKALLPAVLSQHSTAAAVSSIRLT